MLIMQAKSVFKFKSLIPTLPVACLQLKTLL